MLSRKSQVCTKPRRSVSQSNLARAQSSNKELLLRKSWKIKKNRKKWEKCSWAMISAKSRLINWPKILMILSKRPGILRALIWSAASKRKIKIIKWCTGMVIKELRKYLMRYKMNRKDYKLRKMNYWKVKKGMTAEKLRAEKEKLELQILINRGLKTS